MSDILAETEQDRCESLSEPKLQGDIAFRCWLKKGHEGEHRYGAAQWRSSRVELEQELSSLRQELEQSRVNEGEAMLVLEGTETKLEEAKLKAEMRLEQLKLGAWAYAQQYAKAKNLQAENEKLRAALLEVEATKSGRR